MWNIWYTILLKVKLSRLAPMLCAPMLDHHNRPTLSYPDWLANVLYQPPVVEGWDASQREQMYSELISLPEKIFFSKYDTFNHFGHLLQATVRDK